MRCPESSSISGNLSRDHNERKQQIAKALKLKRRKKN